MVYQKRKFVRKRRYVNNKNKYMALSKRVSALQKITKPEYKYKDVFRFCYFL